MNSIILAVMLALAVGESQTVKVDDRTEAKITVQQESVKVNWVCNESNMTQVKNYYKKDGSRWNLFAGETVDLWFSPNSWRTHKVVYEPKYRIITNPSKNFFTAFIGVARPSKDFLNRVEKNDTNWSVEWIFPYAALETSEFTKPASKKVYPPANYWAFQFNRRSESSGKATYTKSPAVVIEIPQKVIAPYQQIMMYGFAAKNGAKAGQTVVDFTLQNRSQAAFNGKMKIVLLEGKEETLLKEEAITIPGKSDKAVNYTATLPEKAVKFGIKVYVYNAAGTLVRISRDLPVDNPWVAF